ncbi:SWI/SNF-related matrix-associated actin-dependent regulator of chromatin subfamily A-like protein 1 isoform X2 [Nilaparvata lugens]|nr:SWI/SNF-related matrix-associated actin-dependent regulator of chromatin subfamily A-like protein 1 isoform X2 [Nilaparvata lugens]XP_039293296.1 SWI/SNF-related matrix-associated actin-dependent regulator of chromatin subfamily A-like protein 1 isoform X2 [Nilaparvata lugens]XP_039293303.1 SWI/SNF-related matrix-associated actin-dependent regulator of chromatin subfamily A-like protein 1 isoform X2 [Nilaparvata lugens]XP_039293309.1 SWI/SNF-related matrix-associated actin-dependent regulator
MSSLTPEQLKRIEENRLAAIRIREAKLKIQQQNVGNKPLIRTAPLASANTYAPVPRAGSANNNSIQSSISRIATEMRTNFYSSNKDAAPKRKLQELAVESGPAKKTGGSLDNKFKQFNSNQQTASVANNPTDFLKVTVGFCELISDSRFRVQMDYNQKALDLFKTIPGKMYDSKSRDWNFPLTEHKTLISKCDVLRPQVHINPLPQFIIKHFITKRKNSTESYKDIDISPVESTLRNYLYPFQIEGVQFGVSKDGKCLIADDMGLGKTIQALGIASYYRNDWPLLIVCPSSMRYQWLEDVCRLLPSVPMHNIFVLKTGKDYIEESLVKVLILSYDLLGRMSKLLNSIKFGVIILDESHSLKSGASQRSKTALDMVKHLSRVILLSGTPALSRPVELYTQLVAMQPNFFGNFREYAKRYCDAKQNRFGWDNSGSSHVDELKIVLESKFMIRRLKQDVLTQLPSKVRQVVILNSDTIKTTKEMQSFHDTLTHDQLSHSEKRSQIMLYYGETGKNKLKAVCEYIEKLLDENKKFLCFAHHREVLDGICQTLIKKSVKFIRIDGRVQTDERKRLCDDFQTNSSCRVAVLSIKAANTGLTLTAAHLVVFAELFWNPGDLFQAEDRVHRIGQVDSVHIQYLLAKGTCDDFMWPLIESKLTVLNKVGLTSDSLKDTADVTETSVSKTKQPNITDFLKDVRFDDDEDDDLLNSVMDSFDQYT